MKSIEIGKSAVVASQAALGVMRMDALDADAAAEVVRTAAEHGVNFFDTADIYGFNVNHDHASSRVLGRAWKDAGLKREDIFLQTKFGINIDFSDPNNVHATRYDFSAKHLITRLDEELEALGTDYVDFALLHRPDTLMEAEEIVEAFTTLHKAGKVRHFGVSNVNPWQAELLQSWLGDDPAMSLHPGQLRAVDHLRHRLYVHSADCPYRARQHRVRVRRGLCPRGHRFRRQGSVDFDQACSA